MIGPVWRLSHGLDDYRRTVRAAPGGHRSEPLPPAGTPRRKALVAVAAGVLILFLVATAYVARESESSQSPAVSATERWVSAEGSDDAQGSASRPWRTLSHAVQAAPADAVIYVRDGTYQPFTVTRKGLTISGAPGDRPTIQGRAGLRDVVLVTADDVTLTDLTVAGCVPNPRPDVNVNGDHGSGIRMHKTRGVTVRDVIVRDSRGVNANGLPVGCYGILATESRNVMISSSEVYHNGAGIVVTGGGRGVVVEGNNVHDQNVILQNSAEQFDDFGGYGLAATFVTDKPGPVFRGNTVVRNVGPSTDYGVDGGGIEIYDAANTTVSGNTFAENDGAVETGTGARGRCADNVFSGNTVTGGSTPTGRGRFTGLLLRCAANMAIRGNTFTDLDNFTFLLSSDGQFAGSVDGLQITGNSVTRHQNAVVYRLQFRSSPATPPMSVDDNRYRVGQDRFAVIDDGAETAVSFEDWKSRTGFDARSALF